jgi:hypothetical protein
MTTQLETAFALIDAANAADPTQEDGQPAAKLYGERMTLEAERLFPNASDILRIAARGQHVERWLLKRTAFPEGKEGYYAWRREQGRRHGARVAGIMAKAGYGEDEQLRVGVLLRKEGIKRDSEVQALEDIICFVFIRWYFSAFAAKRSAEDLQIIVEKTARKMSAEAQARVLAEFTLPPALAAAFAP